MHIEARCLHLRSHLSPRVSMPTNQTTQRLVGFVEENPEKKPFWEGQCKQKKTKQEGKAKKNTQENPKRSGAQSLVSALSVALLLIAQGLLLLVSLSFCGFFTLSLTNKNNSRSSGFVDVWSSKRILELVWCSWRGNVKQTKLNCGQTHKTNHSIKPTKPKFGAETNDSPVCPRDCVL